jgi:hypothetical protein
MSSLTPEARDLFQTFDAQAYLGANPDVKAAGVDPFTHYLNYGKKEGRQFTAKAAAPTPPQGPAPIGQNVFDAQSYLADNPDVARAGMDPYQHYIQYGLKEGRNAKVMAPPVPITQYVASQVQNPTLPNGAEFVPTMQAVQKNEMMTAGPGVVIDPNATQVNPLQQVQPGTINQTVAQGSAPVQAAQGAATQVNPNAVMQGYDPNAGQTTSTMTQAVAPMQAEQGTVSKEATVQGQLEKLMNFGPGNVPAWAQGALTKAEESMAARGLGASSIAAGAITAAIQQAALPIAAQDAASFFQMDITNLDNRQQATLENVRMRQQNMLTDTAISNATKQFNSANAQQSEQFTTSLVASIAEQNAARKDAMTNLNVTQGNTVSLENADNFQENQQFNSGQANQISAQNVSNKLQADEYNVQKEAERQQFNATIRNQREQFNSQMQFAIDQSNVTWRRAVNTQNTMAVNSANQANVQNAFNMSAVAQNNIWQQFRDEASWMFTAAQNEQERAYNTAMGANNRQYASDAADEAQKNAMMAQLGSLALNWFMG